MLLCPPALSLMPLISNKNAAASQGRPHTWELETPIQSGDSLSESLRTLQAPVCTWPGPGRVLVPLLGHWWQMVTPGYWWPIRAQDGWGLTNHRAGQPVCPDMCLAPLSLCSVRDKQPVTLETRETNTISVKSQLISRQSLVIEQYQVQVWPS